jgi:hypothetical protein
MNNIYDELFERAKNEERRISMADLQFEEIMERQRTMSLSNDIAHMRVSMLFFNFCVPHPAFLTLVMHRRNIILH